MTELRPEEYDSGPFAWCPECDEEFHHSAVEDNCPKCGTGLK